MEKYTLDNFQDKKDKGREFWFINKAKFIKESLQKIKGMDLEFKSMQMATYILESFQAIKNMGKANFIGSVLHRKALSQ